MYWSSCFGAGLLLLAPLFERAITPSFMTVHAKAKGQSIRTGQEVPHPYNEKPRALWLLTAAGLTAPGHRTGHTGYFPLGRSPSSYKVSRFASNCERVKETIDVKRMQGEIIQMDHKEQITAFQADVERLVDRYRAEFNLTYAAAIGVLEVVKLDLWEESRKEDD